MVNIILITKIVYQYIPNNNPKILQKKSHLLVGVGEFSRATRPDLTTTRPQLAAATMIIEHGLIYYIWTDGLKVAELGNNWNNTRKNGMRIKVRSRGELNGKNNPSFEGNHWPGPIHTVAHAVKVRLCHR